MVSGSKVISFLVLMRLIESFTVQRCDSANIVPDCTSYDDITCCIPVHIYFSNLLCCIVA